jgi:predicted Zn-dependent protease
MAMSMVGGPVVAVARQVAGVAVPMTFLKFSRNAEREADLLGLEYQYAAGYDPVALVDVFERVQTTQKKKGFLAKSFETHPMKEERVKQAQNVIETLLPARADYVVSTSAFQEMKNRVAELTHRVELRHGVPGLVLHRDTRPAPEPQPQAEP